MFVDGKVDRHGVDFMPCQVTCALRAEVRPVGVESLVSRLIMRPAREQNYDVVLYGVGRGPACSRSATEIGVLLWADWRRSKSSAGPMYRSKGMLSTVVPSG